jgi:hypothetical protein
MTRAWWIALVSVAACSKPGAEGQPDAGAAAPVASTVVSTADARAEASPAANNATVAWTGKYTSTAGTLYIPEDWKSVHWNVPDSAVGLGEGSLNLEVDGATGRVSGTVAGPLGPATLAGIASDGKISATVARQDASDRGFAGTLQGTLAGDHGEGTIQVSLAEVSAVRTATFSLSKSGEGTAAPPR